MTGCLSVFHQQVVNIYFYVSANLIPEHFVDQSLISGPNILLAEWHNLVTIQFSFGNKGGLLLVDHVHVYLIVSREGIHELRSLCLDVESTKRSIRGNGKLSFEQALLRSVKPTHILHLPLDFWTNGTLANHSG